MNKQPPPLPALYPPRRASLSDDDITPILPPSKSGPLFEALKDAEDAQREAETARIKVIQVRRLAQTALFVSLVAFVLATATWAVIAYAYFTN